MRKRKVIGLLVSGISDDFTVRTCHGVMRAARDLDVDVVILPGKYLGRDLSYNKDIIYEYQYNTLFDYAKDGRFDALLVTSGCIGCFAPAEDLKDFLMKLGNVPCILIGDKREGFLSVSSDNFSGIREGMEYLIGHRNCKDIVLAGGSSGNTDACERREAYEQVMKEHGLKADASRVLEGDLSRFQKQLFLDYLDRCEKIPDAFVCVNDETAISAYEALDEKGIAIGKDVYVMGFDNILRGAKMKPSLSSVMSDTASMGEHALRLALDALEGKSVQSLVIPTRFIRRESCGADPDPGKNFVSQAMDPDRIDECFEEIFYRCASKENYADLKTSFHEIMESLITFHRNKGSREEMYAKLPHMIEAFCEDGALEQADMERLLLHLEEVTSCLMADCGSMERAGIISQAVGRIYRKVILSEETAQGKMLYSMRQKDYDIKMFVTKSMQFEKGSSKSFEAILEDLEWMDITDAVLYTYDKPVTHLDRESFLIPDHLNITAVLHNGEVKTTFGRAKKVSSSELFHHNAYWKGGAFQVLLPIFSNENLYGIFLCNMSEKLFENGEFLTGQLGIAAKMITLLRANEEIQNQYEESMVMLKKNNIELDTLAKSDGLTGSLNRRGFMEEASSYLEKEGEKKDLLVAYIDMNNLKIVNDRYGHDEGDFSIQTISRLLKEIFPKGIIGRIGGDEFALMTDYAGEDPDEVKTRIYRTFSTFNAGSDRPFHVTVSAGICVIYRGRPMELADALNFADEKLYLEKQKRPKVVAKK